jgi:hypothetical protein
MRGTDKFLIAIVVGALLVAGAAAASTLLRPSAAVYRPDDSAEGVAFNYIFALQQGNYARAYGYLSTSAPNYPTTVEAFATDLGSPKNYGMDANASLATNPAQMNGNLATVMIRETTFYSGGLFSSGEQEANYNVMLRREAVGWRIVNSDRFWSPRWQR